MSLVIKRRLANLHLYRECKKIAGIDQNHGRDLVSFVDLQNVISCEFKYCFLKFEPCAVD